MSAVTAKTIGRYQVIKEIGRGGMATVFQAYDPQFERTVALKLLPTEFLHDPMFRARFEREAKTIAALEHSAIVPVYDFGEDNGQPYLVMRFMHGGSLAERIAAEALSIEETLHIFEHLAPALDRAHERGIVHRDLKPANILLDNDGDPYLSDFGIVKISEASAVYTGSGIIGTPSYMSPEQARGEDSIDGRSDIYALGTIVYEILTGRLPFHADTPMGVAVKQITEPIPDILKARPDLPAAIGVVMRHVLAKNPDERIGTASEFVDALSDAFAGESLPETRLDSGLGKTLMPSAYESAVPEKLQPPQAGERKNAARGIPKLSAIARRRRKPETAEGPSADIPGRLKFWRWILLAGLFSIAIVSVVFARSLFPSLSLFAVAQSTPTSKSASTSTIATPASLGSSTPVKGDRPSVTPEGGLAALPQPSETPLPLLSRIAFVSDRSGMFDLYTMLPDGAELRQLTFDVDRELGLAWSPDSSQIAYESSNPGRSKRIYVIPADGGEPNWIFQGDRYAGDPSWSEAGIALYAGRCMVDDCRTNMKAMTYEIYSMQPDGSGFSPVTFDSSLDLSPDWSPDGQRIVYSSYRGTDSLSLFIIAADRKGGRQSLFIETSLNQQPAWSPDGSLIAFSSTRTGDRELFLIRPDGSALKQLTENPAEDITPSWSPDSKRLAFASDRDGNFEIYVIDITSGDLVRLTENAEDDLFPAWSQNLALTD